MIPPFQKIPPLSTLHTNHNLFNYLPLQKIVHLGHFQNIIFNLYFLARQMLFNLVREIVLLNMGRSHALTFTAAISSLF